MTTSTPTKTETQVFNITYTYTAYHSVSVERPSDISEEELLSSITRDELASGSDSGDAWSSLKDSWRESQPGQLDITDEEMEPLFQN